MPPVARKPKAPQDRHPAKGALFSFVGHDGKSHTLPLASEGAEKVSGRVMRDAFMGADSGGELKLGFAMLEACGAPQPVVDALYDLPSPECLKVLGEWMGHGDGQGTSAPQSSSSLA